MRRVPTHFLQLIIGELEAVVREVAPDRVGEVEPDMLEEVVGSRVEVELVCIHGLGAVELR